MWFTQSEIIIIIQIFKGEVLFTWNWFSWGSSKAIQSSLFHDKCNQRDRLDIPYKFEKNQNYVYTVQYN